jgi:hypothetical protein
MSKMSKEKEKKKNLLYTDDDLRKAIEETQNGTSTAWKAAEKFKIPFNTLKYKINDMHGGKYGAATRLSAEDEEQLCSWIKRRARMGFPIDKKEFLYAAIQITEKREGKKFTEKG